MPGPGGGRTHLGTTHAIVRDCPAPANLRLRRGACGAPSRARKLGRPRLSVAPCHWPDWGFQRNFALLRNVRSADARTLKHVAGRQPFGWGQAADFIHHPDESSLNPKTLTLCEIDAGAFVDIFLNRFVNGSKASRNFQELGASLPGNPFHPIDS